MRIVLILLSFSLLVLFSGCEPSEDAYLNQGKNYLSQGEFTQAIALLSKAKEKIPQRKDEICLLLGKAHLGRSKELNGGGRYQKAMEEYQRALGENRKIANLGYQIELLYGLAGDQLTSPKDIEILRIQKMVFLNREAVEYRKELAEVASLGDRIIVFGLGLSPEEYVNKPQGKLLALRAAKMDAHRWLSYHLVWEEYGFSGDVTKISVKVPGGTLLQELDLGFGAYLIKIELSRKALA